MNVVEKIVQRSLAAPIAGQVAQKSFVSIRPRHVMTHDNTFAVLAKFTQLGASRVAQARQPVFCLDHNVQDKSAENLARYSAIQQFAADQGISFFPAGRGIGHQVMCEEGFIQPGSLVVASGNTVVHSFDSHSNMYGGLGCLGTPVVRTDAAAIWATSKTWWQVPNVARVRLHGALQPEVSGKDVVLTLCALWPSFASNACVEFQGEGCRSLGVEDRLTIANMTTEWGALAGVFPVDEQTRDYLRLSEQEVDAPVADADAQYIRTLDLDLSSISPVVSGPNSLTTTHSVYDLEQQKIPIQKAYLLSCVNGRQGDIRAASRVFSARGASVRPGVKLWIGAASSKVQQECQEDGSWQVLVDAGARVLPPGCGPCIGLGSGLLEKGDTAISATNRNFVGRMGHRDAQAYLASPAVVAASAIQGFISSPGASVSQSVSGKVTVEQPIKTRAVREPPVEGFPLEMQGRVLCTLQDSMNTDGIYAGQHTYRDLTPEQQARVAFENYDANFKNVARKGDILVGGFNWGVGSSREQAATALLHFGIQCVLVGSVSETYKRNALNNGLLVVEVPDLVNALQGRQVQDATWSPGSELRVDFAGSTVEFEGERYPFVGTVGSIAQQLIAAGGLEPMVKQEISK